MTTFSGWTKHFVVQERRNCGLKTVKEQLYGVSTTRLGTCCDSLLVVVFFSIAMAFRFRLTRGSLTVRNARKMGTLYNNQLQKKRKRMNSMRRFSSHRAFIVSMSPRVTPRRARCKGQWPCHAGLWPTKVATPPMKSLETPIHISVQLRSQAALTGE